MATVAEITSKFTKKHGENSIKKGNEYDEVTRLPTGVFEVDLATGGGIPRGRVSEIYGPESSGKCHAAGALILMFDGTLKPVEQIQPGDKVMGVDSQPRTVTGIGQGYGPLYRVTPVKGADPFVVNGEHVLSLVCTHDQGHRRTGDVVNISVLDYLPKSNDWKVYHHLYRVPVEFEAQRVPLDPYFLGLWLGDGNARTPAITTLDPEIVDWLQGYADRLCLELSVYGAEDRCPSYAIVMPQGPWAPGSRDVVVPKLLLAALGVLPNKKIPHAYKANSRAVRLALLAGLLDSDGAKGSGSSATFYNVNRRLCEDVLFLARSLGFYASLSPKNGSYKGEPHQSWVVYVSGDFSEVPMLLDRKRPEPRRRSGSALTSRFTVEEIGEAAYYGFELDGDHLYLLDSFIVNHNTNLVLKAIASNQRLHPEQDNVYFDLENVYVPSWAASLGVDTEKLLIVKPQPADIIIDMFEAFLYADNIGLLALDSIAALVTQNEIDSAGEKVAVAGVSGPVAKLVRKVTFGLAAQAERNHYPVVIYVNQIRYKIGVMFGNPETTPGGNAPRFQYSLRIRCYGKNIANEKIHKTMPILKETQFIVQKWKMPIVATHGVYQMVTLPHAGMKIGETDNWNLVLGYLKDYGFVAKKAKGTGWLAFDQEYKTLKEIEEQYHGDAAWAALVRKAVVERLMDDEAAAPPEGEIDEETGELVKEPA
jgi:RecA/RadA recombinase